MLLEDVRALPQAGVLHILGVPGVEVLWGSVWVAEPCAVILNWYATQASVFGTQTGGFPR